MNIHTTEIYRSAADGDRWLLARDASSGRVFVRHEPNQSSAGISSEIDLGTFLAQPGDAPEKVHLLQMIGNLVKTL